MNRDNIRVSGHVGTWYVIDEKFNDIHGKIYLLEHEQYGDLAACVIVNSNCELLKQDVFNGLDDINE